MQGASDSDTCNLAAKSDLPNLRVKVDKIDIYQLETVPAPLSKLNNIVNNNTIKNLKLVDNDKLVTKINAIAISEFVLETQYNTDNIGLGKKTNDPDKKKYMILVDLLRKQIIMLRSLRLNVKHLVLMASLLLLLLILLRIR